jgi:hypothetical protein
VNRRRALSPALVAAALALASCSRTGLDVTGLAPEPTPGEPEESGSPGVGADADSPLDAPEAEAAPDVSPPDSPADAPPPDSAPDAPVEGGLLTFVSGADWGSYAGVPSSGSPPTDALGTSLGPAAVVCLEPYQPASCPPGAFLYDFGGDGQAWQGGQTLAGASWIWRADVSLGAPSALAVAVFQRTFTVGSGPTGTIRIAADDYAAVYVNDMSVGAVGSVTDISAALNAQDTPTAIDLTPALHAGDNTIVIVGQNGAYGCASPCPYSQNPAGVVFTGTIRW